MANTTRNMEGRALIRPWLNVRGQSKPNPGLVMLGRVVAPFVNSIMYQEENTYLFLLYSKRMANLRCLAGKDPLVCFQSTRKCL